MFVASDKISDSSIMGPYFYPSAGLIPWNDCSDNSIRIFNNFLDNCLL